MAQTIGEYLAALINHRDFTDAGKVRLYTRGTDVHNYVHIDWPKVPVDVWDLTVAAGLLDYLADDAKSAYGPVASHARRCAATLLQVVNNATNDDEGDDD